MYFLYLFVWNKKVPIQTNTEKSTKRAHFCFWLCFASTLKNKTPTKKTYFVLLPPSKIKPSKIKPKSFTTTTTSYKYKFDYWKLLYTVDNFFAIVFLRLRTPRCSDQYLCLLKNRLVQIEERCARYS